MPAFVRYMSCLPRTLLLHKQYGYAGLAAFVYLPAITLMHAGRLLIIRSYDTASDSFSPRHIFRETTDRIAP